MLTWCVGAVVYRKIYREKKFDGRVSDIGRKLCKNGGVGGTRKRHARDVVCSGRGMNT